MKKIHFTVVIVFLTVHLADAQQPEIKLPKVIPASPTASDLAKYINYPVSYANGLPDINIPIYTIKDGDINIPISLSYHASGFKLYHTDGWLSRGWTLNAEPMISRSIQGLPDENAYILNNAHAPEVLTDPNYKNSLEDGIRDEQPDEFYFKLPDQSGKFYIKKQYNTPLEFITVPHVPVKVKVADENNLSQFTILDNKGLSYSFGGPQYSNTEMTDLGNITCWKPTALTSTLTGKTVLFRYYPQFFRNIDQPSVSRISILDSCISSYLTFASNPLNPQVPPPPYQLQLPAVLEQKGSVVTYYTVNTQGQLQPMGGVTSDAPDVSDTKISQLDIQEIIFSNGKVSFTKENEILRFVRIFDKQNMLIKEFEFHQRLLAGTLYRLDSVRIKDRAQATVERYAFEYNSYTANMPQGAIDHWGYFNNAQNNGQMVPSITTHGRATGGSSIINFSIGGANRYPNEFEAQANMLKSIIYPTGGRTDFEYEGNRYMDANGQLQLAGGLRIKTIMQKDGKGDIIYRFFTYAPGILKMPIDKENFLVARNEIYCRPSPIVYDEQAGNPPYRILQNANGPASLRRRTYSSNSLIDLFYESGSPVQYPEVTEFTAKDQWGMDAIGKQVFHYDVVPGSFRSKMPGEATVFDLKTSWYTGEDTLNAVFKSAANVFSPVLKKYKYYIIKDLPDRVFTIGKTHTYQKTIADQQYYASCRQSYEIISLYRYDVKSGYKTPSETKEISVTDGGELTKGNKYAYDDYLNLVEEKYKTSGGDSMTISYEYPYSSGSGMNLYLVNNNTSPRIAVKKLSDNVLLEQTKTSYLADVQGVVTEQKMPVSMAYYGKGSLTPDNQVNFIKYDQEGNLLSMHKAGDYKTNYIYAYNGAYPIAKIENADYATVESVLGGATAVENFRNMATPSDANVNSFLAPLRTNPSLSTAFITTYTYIPLVGMTSETGPRGMTIYYEYDSFNRLKLTRDHQGKILRQFDYQYQASSGQ